MTTDAPPATRSEIAEHIAITTRAAFRNGKLVTEADIERHTDKLLDELREDPIEPADLINQVRATIDELN